jgi:outer membrane protein assembly factor BamB
MSESNSPESNSRGVKSARRQARTFVGALAAVAAAAVFASSLPLSAPARAADTAAKPSGQTAKAPELPGAWPQWRGPNRDGKSLETGLLKKWPEGGPPLAWKTTGLGLGFGSIAVVKGRIYASGDVGDTAYLMALDENGGKQIWKAKIGKSGEVGGPAFPGPRSTATIDGDHAYIIGQYGDIVCVATADGKEVWHKDMEKDFGAQMMTGWGYSESPLVDGDHVIISPGGKGGTLAALDKKTGDVVWRSTEWTDKSAYGSIVTAEFGGKHQYVQITDRNVAGVDATNGKVLWKAAAEGKTAVIPDPVVSPDGYVYVSRGYGVGCDCFKVTAEGGSFSVKPLYQQKKVMVNKIGGTILLDGYIYGHSEGKGWTCQDLVKGDLVWKQKENAIGMGSITYADGHFYLRQDSGPGTVGLIEATPKGYHEVGRFDQPDRSKADHPAGLKNGQNSSWTPPVVADGKLYIRDHDLLLCYDVKAK